MRRRRASDSESLRLAVAAAQSEPFNLASLRRSRGHGLRPSGLGAASHGRGMTRIIVAVAAARKVHGGHGQHGGASDFDSESQSPCHDRAATFRTVAASPGPGAAGAISREACQVCRGIARA